MAVTTFHDFPLALRDRKWDGAAAEKRVRKWAHAEDHAAVRLSSPARRAGLVAAAGPAALAQSTALEKRSCPFTLHQQASNW